jgi:hypothetical protein
MEDGGVEKEFGNGLRNGSVALGRFLDPRVFELRGVIRAWN